MLHGLFERLFSRNNIALTSCAGAPQAIEELEEQEFDLVITDFMMPDMDGLELLAHIREEYPETRVMMITAHANVQHAVRVMKTGAIDYMPKPFSTSEMIERVQKCLSRSVEAEETKPAPKKARRSRRASSAKTAFIGQHSSVERLKAMLQRLSANKAPVFIQGESGTGKEILARRIHEESDRADGPYVPVNCATLPRELAESHLFGHRKGAFTGAVDDMTGAFEQANGGTLLLDEITEVSQDIQAKLLRVLQEQEIQKVGESTTKKVDVRIIATSNRNLSEAIDEGVFREDLYHRLAVFPLSVPPLRERRSDIPLLVEHFVEKYSKLYGLPIKRVSEELMREFKSQVWPGNVRQLENMVQRGVILSAEREVISPKDVVADFFVDAEQEVPTGINAAAEEGLTIADMEREMILETLELTDHNQKETAERLGVSARTIRNKLKRYREEGHID